ncbi:histidine phosphatase family protein [Salipaludibacillus daqingensis]|uniref:histidine phosphatase family protein n=1 Tax=Salipaludibacillus daqingensis TaxID=3041001 RepID=UPI0024754AA2|nr:histidine phosphatase family protein [Salipaludibacillus daqingensis]
MCAFARLDLYLIRHGVTTWNKEKRYLGHSDEPVEKDRLKDLFAIKNELKDVSFDGGIWTSDLKRCQQTLQYLLPENFYNVDERLREYNFGDWEGKTYDDLKEIVEYRQWIDNWQGNRAPRGETGKGFTERIQSWVDEFFSEIEEPSASFCKNCLVVTHGGVIRYLLSTLDGSKSFWDWRVNHGEGVKLSFIFREGKWECSSLSAVPTPEKGNS